MTPHFLPQEIIRKKRDGGALAPDELSFFAAGLAGGTISEGQAGAFAMAVFLNGMSLDECVALTRAMTSSGNVLRWDDLDRPVLDKHSTGGVGDKVSLVLAPILAACGAAVPMISGRGLGHTGGTLDKLDAIPGYISQPDIDSFRRVVAGAGCAIIGQTAELAPADRRLYAVRDVTATVESIPLITASILSKKLAAGLQCLIMDVKTGSGAFMSQIDDARALADSIVQVAEGAGLRTGALITDMNQVLGRTAGNAVELREAIDMLLGVATEPRFVMVTHALAVVALTIGGLTKSGDEAAEMVGNALASGAAAEHFARMVAGLGGPADLLDAPARHLPAAPVRTPALPAHPGIVAAVDTRAVGLAVLSLGGGRTRADADIDHAVGLTDIAGIGEAVGPDRPLAIVHARDDAAAESAAAQLRNAIALGDDPVAPGPAVISWAST